MNELADTLQEVLNWCDGIEDDDSRLPLDLKQKAILLLNENERVNTGDLHFGNELPQVIQRAAVKASEVPTGKLYDPTAFVFGEGEN